MAYRYHHRRRCAHIGIARGIMVIRQQRIIVWHQASSASLASRALAGHVVRQHDRRSAAA